MPYNFDNLEPLVRQILSAPGTDLTTISAKRVRRELLTLDPSLTPEFIKANKLDVDALITRVFEEVNAAQNGEAADDPEEPVTVSRQYSTSDQEEEEEEEEEEPKPKKVKKGSQKEMSDAELARQLSSEINGRSSARRNTGKGRAGNGTPKRSKPRTKSATTVNSDDEDSGEEGGKKTKKKRAGGGAAKGGFAKEFTLSAPLAALLQVEKLSRPQVVKQLWVYIKENERQNPSNKREILCDQNLRAIFNVDKIDMFRMNKVLSSHLHEE
ncbi:SWIB/MDM2 domain-containing protein [Lentinula raphanica]|uniref:SWIB/MDM2 domain-containing protein n=1 Tax=Lentinula raphanica TaxID=153919 RepID=A0AA38P9M1_9AGAR|nr:SWIB/MDM2 domain-containing protein [Lentinula raphanica]KAJ3826831.1 SWIB/MDM2 domain-containing protein [Lentinula raphanica]KAJ3838882.1 SWIB/MDM2 domain-containing protein [Lentinula raphanica]KAJ3975063.1 SWIB/MDM2 domain-containing protein [Lentinula raphanica]